MSAEIRFREKAVAAVSSQIGVYALCDLDKAPIYVGQSRDGIRARVRRHLTSARSDIIANRQIDVWEIAWVLTWPVDARDQINALEAQLFHWFDKQSPLMNGTAPKAPFNLEPPRAPQQEIQLVSDEQIERRRDPIQRLPRQIEHYSQIVGHFLVVKDSSQIQRSMRAHFERLAKYHASLMSQIGSNDQTGDS